MTILLLLSWLLGSAVCLSLPKVQENIQEDGHDDFKEEVLVEVQEDVNDDVKEDVQDEVQEDTKEDVQADVQEDTKEDVQEDTKEDVQEDTKEEVQDPAKLISIAEHLRREHLQISNYEPSVLRSVVQQPSSLEILPRNVLQRLFDDPIFNVHLPQEALDKISDVLREKGDDFSADHDVEYEEDKYEYDDYIDYSNYDDDDGVETVGKFLSDLDPEFLATVSPALIVGYIEGASTADLKEILNSSTLLRKLPVETIGELLKKLPRDLILEVVNSKGVEDLFREAFDNTTSAEKGRIKAFQDSLAPIVVRNLDTEILGSLPLSLLKIHLNIESAVLELFRSSDKLEAIITNYPSLLSQIDFKFIASILLKHPELESKISDKVILALLDVRPNILLEFPITFLQNIARDRPELVADFSEQTIRSLAQRPEILFELPDEHLMNLIKQKPAILEILLYIPSDILIQLVENRPQLLDIIPANAEESLTEVILTLVNSSPDLLIRFPITFLMDIARDRPELVADFSEETIRSLARRPEILFELPEEDLMNLIEQKPSFLKILLYIPTDILIHLVENRPQLLDIIPLNAEESLSEVILSLVNSSPDLIIQFPTQFLLDIARNRPSIVADFPQQVINNLAFKPEVLFSLSDQELERLLTLRPSLLQILVHLQEDVLIRFLQVRPNLLDVIPANAEESLTEVILTLVNSSPDLLIHFPITFLMDIARDRPELVADFSEETIRSLAQRPEILFELPDEHLMNLIEQKPSFLEILIYIPSDILIHLVEIRPQLLDIIPLNAEGNLRAVILTLMNESPDLLIQFPNTFLQDIARKRPELVADFPEESIRNLAQRPEILFELSDENLMKLIELKPSILEILLYIPTDILAQLIENRPQLLDIIPLNAEESLSEVILSLVNSSPDLIIQFPTQFLLDIARNRPWIVADFPQQVINNLAFKPEVLFSLSDQELERLLTLRPSLLQILVHLQEDVLIRFLQVRPNLLDVIPANAEEILGEVILTLVNSSPDLLIHFPITFLMDIARDRPELVADFSEETIRSLAQRPEILFELPEEDLMNLIEQKPSFLKILLYIPTDILIHLVENRPQLLDIIPINAEESLSEVILSLVNSSPDLIIQFPTQFLLDIARNRPSIVADFPQEVINNLAFKPEVLFSLSDQELERLLTLRPSLLQILVHLQEDVLIRLLQVRPNLPHIIPPVAEPALEETILQLLQQRPNLVLSLPIRFIIEIAGSRPWLVAQFPQVTIDLLTSRTDILFLLSDSQLRSLLSYRPGIMMVLPTLPKRVLWRFISQRSNILDLIPLQAEPYLRNLLSDSRFILKLKPEDLAMWADHKVILKFLDKYTIIFLLRIHPSLVRYINLQSLDYFIKYLKDPWFRMRIPCETVSIMSDNSKLLVSLPIEIIGKPSFV